MPEARLAWLEQRRQQKLAEAQRPEAWLSASFVAQVHRRPTGRPTAQLVRVARPRARAVATAVVAPPGERRASPVWLEQVTRHAEAELAPVCAIVGGVVASEVIKIISGKGAPINNAFFFDALQTSEGAPPGLRLAPWPTRCLAS